MNKFYKPSRMAVVFICIVVVIGIFMTTLYKLQLFNISTNDATAAWDPRDTTSNTVTIAAKRGDILDRNGNLLVSSRPAYNITIARAPLLASPDPNGIVWQLISTAMASGIPYTDTFPMTSGAPFVYLSGMTAAQSSTLAAYLKFSKLDPNISASDLFNWMKSHYGIDYTTSISDARLIIGVRYELETRVIVNSAPSLYVFASDVPDDFVNLVKSMNLIGVNVQTVSVRQYDTTYAAQILGYVGQMDAAEYQKYKSLGYPMDAIVGQDGVEQAFEQYLHGTDGSETITTTKKTGMVVNDTVTAEPVPGDNVYLTIDIGLQASVETALANCIDGINATRADPDKSPGGAAVVTDVNTGELLACASYPTYDPSTMKQNYTALANDPDKPLFNRATQGVYNPGSTFKMATALAGLRAGAITRWTTIDDSGKFTRYPDYQPSCWLYTLTGHGHGPLDIVGALVNSCNVFFYTVGDTVGADAIANAASDFGLGAKTGLEIPESAGTVASPANKQAILNESWWAGDTLQAAIGQNLNMFTPVQMANYVATVANGGALHQISILDEVKSPDYTTVVAQHQTNDLPTNLLKSSSDSNYIAILQEGMRAVGSTPVVEDTTSVYSIFGDSPVAVAAKTGTVQTGNAINNGVFVCYAPATNPQIAISIVVEKGNSGSTIMQIGKAIVDYYFQTQTDFTVVPEGSLIP